jgi:hypothetical protein
MATSPETFNQVRNLLRKMDQSIDQARGKRLSGNEPAPLPPPASAATASGPQTLIGAPAAKPAMGPAASGPTSVTAAQRARPLAARMEGPSRFGQQPPHSKAG